MFHVYYMHLLSCKGNTLVFKILFVKSKRIFWFVRILLLVPVMVVFLHTRSSLMCWSCVCVGRVIVLCVMCSGESEFYLLYFYFLPVLLTHYRVQQLRTMSAIQTAVVLLDQLNMWLWIVLIRRIAYCTPVVVNQRHAEGELICDPGYARSHRVQSLFMRDRD
jgi:hypothetical protein